MKKLRKRTEKAYVTPYWGNCNCTKACKAAGHSSFVATILATMVWASGRVDGYR